jgi:hypothetical protein
MSRSWIESVAWTKNRVEGSNFSGTAPSEEAKMALKGRI